MKRAFMFLIVGPMLIAAVSTLLLLRDGAHGDFLQFVAMALFFLAMPFAGIAALFDAYALSELSIPLRAIVTATVGSIIPVGLLGSLIGILLPAGVLLHVAIVTAVCLAVCSVLANDWGGRRQTA
jgi:hypothetical protein